MNQNEINRWFELMGDDNIPDPVGAFRNEQRNKRLEAMEAARERALDASYRVARVEKVGRYSPNGDALGETDAIQEITVFTNRQLPDFARMHGFDIDELRALVQSQRKEITGKHGIRLQAYPSYYVDRTPRVEDIEQRERDLADDRAFQAKVATRQANKQASKPRSPIFSMFSKG